MSKVQNFCKLTYKNKIILVSKILFRNSYFKTDFVGVKIISLSRFSIPVPLCVSEIDLTHDILSSVTLFFSPLEFLDLIFRIDIKN